MGFAWTVVTGRDGRVECWLDPDGRLRDCENNALVFTERTFADEWSASFYLASDPDARFCFAYLSVDWRRYVESNA